MNVFPPQPGVVPNGKKLVNEKRRQWIKRLIATDEYAVSR